MSREVTASDAEVNKTSVGGIFTEARVGQLR